MVAPGCLRQARHSTVLAQLPWGPCGRSSPPPPPPCWGFVALPQHLVLLPQQPCPLPGAAPALAQGCVPAERALRQPHHCALCCWTRAGRARRRRGGRCRTLSPVGAVPGLATTCPSLARPCCGAARALPITVARPALSRPQDPGADPSCPGSPSQGAITGCGGVQPSLKGDQGGEAEPSGGQAGRGRRRLLVQPPSRSRGSCGVRPGCSQPHPVAS